MWEDPIVAEVHRIREQLAAQHNYDIEAFFADIRKRQAALGDRLVQPGKLQEAAAAAEESRPAGSSEATSTKASPAA